MRLPKVGLYLCFRPCTGQWTTAQVMEDPDVDDKYNIDVLDGGLHDLEEFLEEECGVVLKPIVIPPNPKGKNTKDRWRTIVQVEVITEAKSEDEACRAFDTAQKVLGNRYGRTWRAKGAEYDMDDVENLDDAMPF